MRIFKKVCNDKRGTVLGIRCLGPCFQQQNGDTLLHQAQKICAMRRPQPSCLSSQLCISATGGWHQHGNRSHCALCHQEKENRYCLAGKQILSKQRKAESGQQPFLRFTARTILGVGRHCSIRAHSSEGVWEVCPDCHLLSPGKRKPNIDWRGPDSLSRSHWVQAPGTHSPCCLLDRGVAAEANELWKWRSAGS